MGWMGRLAPQRRDNVCKHITFKVFIRPPGGDGVRQMDMGLNNFHSPFDVCTSCLTT